MADASGAAAEAPSSGSDEGGGRMELVFGFVLAVFAAMLAINELSAGRYGDDENHLHSDKTSAYLWLQSKSIKKSLTEGQLNLLDALVKSGSLAGPQAAEISKQIDKYKEKVERYEKEIKEIELGSKAVGPANQVLEDAKGQKGNTVGTKEIEDQIEQLGEAGDKFDFATLFLQLCMVIGAIGLIMRKEKLKMVFLAANVLLGALGSVFTILALHKVGLF